MELKPLLPNHTPHDGNTETSSQKKIDANRQNAQLSTGPKSAEGKKTSSRNASKHGLLIKDVVITTSANKEDQTEFDALLADLRDCYRPSDLAEDLLVRELAISYWKSARALRCERGDVTCASTEPNESEMSEVELTLLTNGPAADVYRSLRRTSKGIKFLLRKLEQARDEVETSDSLSTELRSWLTPANNWSRILFSGKEHLLAALEKETEELTARKGQVEREENGRYDCSAIPSQKALDRIHRYETSNVRHRYRVEARLEQRQARRREDAKINSGREDKAESSQDTQFFEVKPREHVSDELQGLQGVGLPEQGSDEITIPPPKVGVAEGASESSSDVLRNEANN